MERMAEHLEIISSIAQVLIHIFEIGVYVISVPVERIIVHAQVVSREISRRIPQIVILIPQDTFTERRVRDIEYRHDNEKYR